MLFEFTTPFHTNGLFVIKINRNRNDLYLRVDQLSDFHLTMIIFDLLAKYCYF
jgi:hypothetical protein